jgi:type IV pilus biogenesis protein CpaD/CtpE
MRYAYLLMCIPVVLSGACASNAVQENLGKSVEQMVRAQVSDPATLSGNQDHPVEGIDPEAAKVAIESLRKDTPERAAVRRDILINVGTQQNSGGNQ